MYCSDIFVCISVILTELIGLILWRNCAFVKKITSCQKENVNMYYSIFVH